MDIDLGTLKSEIFDYLHGSDFAVFRSQAGGLDGMAVILWDSEAWPDYRAFLDTARKVGEKLILFSSRELAEDEIDEARDGMEGMELTRDELRDMQSRLTRASRHVGETCSLELAFGHGPNQYVYELQPDWYTDFVDLCDEIESVFTADSGEDAGNDGIGGYYSNN